MNLAMKKIVAIALVVVLLTGAVAVLQNTGSSSSDKEINLIARVNEEGSFIFLDMKYDPSDFCTVDDETGVITYYPEEWEKKIFGTPGITTIQHKMLQSIVENDLNMEFRQYRQDEEPRDNTVYYDATMTNMAVWNASGYMDGGMVWEPVCTAIVNSERGARELLNSHQIDPEHTCCVVAGSHAYLESHEEVVVRFLAAYIESVVLMNDALSAGSGDVDYENLVELAMNSTKQTRNVVITAMEDVKYTYGNDGDGDTDVTPLVSLRSSVAEFLENCGLSVTMSDLGYTGENGYLNYADGFVNDTYLAKALKFVYDPTAKYDYTRINVAVINGDIHQIALHYGISLKVFEKYNIGINIDTAANGQGVVTSLQNGAASIGFMGAPPISLTTVNSKLNTAVTAEVTGIVKDASGNAVEGAEVTFTSAYGDKYTGTTDSNGKYTVKILVGTYNNTSSGDDCGFSVTNGSVSYYTSLARVDGNTDLGEVIL